MHYRHAGGFTGCPNNATEFWSVYEENYFIDVEAYCNNHSIKGKNLPESYTLITETEAENLSAVIDIMAD